MKKIYYRPTLVVQSIETQSIIANSIPKGETPTNPEDYEVKGQGNSNSYDVWSDDWSK